jgi:hypothetical protein
MISEQAFNTLPPVFSFDCAGALVILFIIQLLELRFLAKHPQIFLLGPRLRRTQPRWLTLPESPDGRMKN